MTTRQPDASRDTNWTAAVAILQTLRASPGITRAELARRLSLSTGSATDITARLRNLELLAESPVPVVGRGRPTTVVQPHPSGPLVLAVDLRQRGWRTAVVQLDGEVSAFRETRHTSRDPEAVLTKMARSVSRAHSRYGHRLRAVSVAIAATIHHQRIAQSSTLGWGPVELSALSDKIRLPLLVNNDATLAGVAEARSGGGIGTALHLTVEAGIGGALIVDGRPLTGAGGAGGEYGHLPFGDHNRQCPCGARGCWELEVNADALARHLGDRLPADQRAYATAVLEAAPDDPAARRAVEAVVTALATGTAGLVNAHDPGIVTFGGLAAPLRAAAPSRFRAAYLEGLMTFRRSNPPPVIDAVHGDLGALRGAAAVGLDLVTTPSGLTAWVNRSGETPPHLH